MRARREGPDAAGQASGGSSRWAIEIEDLHKTFTIQHHDFGSLKRALLNVLVRQRREKREVLKGITLRVAHGETVAIVGRNGGGKSTLLSLISRVYRPTSGVVRVHGRIAPLLELGAGFHPDLTGAENVELYGAILGMSRREIRQKFASIVAFAFDRPDLAEKIDTPLRNYSEGMKMRLGFSLAVHTDPDVLIVDEVLAVGDEAFQEKCYARIGEFQRAGKTILFVSHYMHVVRRVATRVVWLRDGVVYRDGPVEPMVEAYVRAAGDGAPPQVPERPR
ncbi:MAG: ABC transporter ATP-binding protein [Chthonomonadales bacterium]|nr:ABC transporter ATP-binding protein [Chthonomonadales bacterium]